MYKIDQKNHACMLYVQEVLPIFVVPGLVSEEGPDLPLQGFRQYQFTVQQRYDSVNIAVDPVLLKYNRY